MVHIKKKKKKTTLKQTEKEHLACIRCLYV